MKRGRGRPPSKNKKPRDDPPQIDDEEELKPASESDSDIAARRKQPKRAAACSDFKEKPLPLEPKKQRVEPQDERSESDEKIAVALTSAGPDATPPLRKLYDFTFHNFDGLPVAVEMSELSDVYISALLMPPDGGAPPRETEVRCKRFGRIESWDISGYDDCRPVIFVSTSIARYECLKPSATYKKFFDRFSEKARICVDVYKRLKGRADVHVPTVDELNGIVTRSLGVGAGRDLMVCVGEFVCRQLSRLSEAAIPSLDSLAASLMAEHKSLPPKTLKIEEGKGLEPENGDERMARLLQEEEDWKQWKSRRARQPSSSSTYIKINEAEIANDYPLPAYYKPLVKEADEYTLFDGDASYAQDLPSRVLNNWCLYNSDSRFISLELLPMKQCAGTDITVFGSGSMMEDTGTGFFFDADMGHSSSAPNSGEVEGLAIYLSAIKEWMIEFGASMNIIRIRTDVAWYRLGKPSKQYGPWHAPVMKIARLAVRVISLLKDESRASKLSFMDVIKKISEFKDGSELISTDVAKVERYVVVHGQIILQQFSAYPDKGIQRCAFVKGLIQKMNERNHTKLQVKERAKLQRKEANLNPNAGNVPVSSKRKLMRATMTRLINRIWGDYYSKHMPEDVEGDGPKPKEEEDTDEEQDENEADDIEEENIFTEVDQIVEPCSLDSSSKCKSSSKEIKWEEAVPGGLVFGEALYKCATVCGSKIAAGETVVVAEQEKLPSIVLVEFLFQKSNGLKMAHGRVLKRGSETILGNAANEREVFLTNECMEFELGNIQEPVTVDFRAIQWGHQYRKEQTNADMTDLANAEERKKKGLPMEFYCKSLYWPAKGAFLAIPSSSLGPGNGICRACISRETLKKDFKMNSSSSFTNNKIDYNVGDYVYVRPHRFGEGKDGHVSFKSGRNVGLKAYVVCHLLEIEASRGFRESTLESVRAKVRRFYRPEDVSTKKAYLSDIREIYYSEEKVIVPLEAIEGKCVVTKKKDLPNLDFPAAVDHHFFCEYSYDANSGSINKLSENSKFISQLLKKKEVVASKNDKGKGICATQNQSVFDQRKCVAQENCLATLDIFAGCGGLSEGLEQSGVSLTKWAIEYEQSAGEAFSLNHPKALMFIDNCNVILRAIMQKCGDGDECISTAEADRLAALLDQEKLNNLPMPGQVDFINGGPPCQGFSGMNRFNQSTWSKVQCEMILAFLSFADYFRPRYFLLENVRNLVSFNKGQTFRLTLASLLEMGYQVRFGILEAGSYGVSQSRKRAFIWAASPDDTLPDWPEPMHVFAGTGLKISLPGGGDYTAARSTAGGAPFRSVTVRDTIGDLPPVGNGASDLTIGYESEPVSWFQKQIKGRAVSLSDHISKEMNELNFIRCQHIPKYPGADWRCLPDEKVDLANGQTVDLIPWCLPNTANRHNQWKGLFGRLDWEGNFPTSITDPQPMGKVGMCFHPDQDRILTVRECARSQGFQDTYQFSGNIQNKHRQIGNAVPPPLAYALGRKLKEAVDSKR